MLDQVLVRVDKIIDNMIIWINKAFGYFGTYTTSYSKYIMYAVLLFIAAKIFRVKLDFKTDVKTGKR